MAGIPLTSGLHRQVGGLHLGRAGRRLAAGRRRGAAQRGGGVLLPPGHRADVLLRPGRRRPDGRDAQRARPRSTSRSASRPRCSSASCPARCSTWRRTRETSSGERPERIRPAWPCRSSTRPSPPGCARAWPRSRTRSRSQIRSRGRLRHRGGPAPAARRRQAVPPAAGAARRGDRPDAGRDEVVTAACVVELTHLASLYHDDVMDEARCAAAPTPRTPAGTTTSRSSPATGCSRSPRSSPPSSAPDAVRIQAQTFTRLVEGQILETDAAGSEGRPARALPRAWSPARPAR